MGLTYDQLLFCFILVQVEGAFVMGVGYFLTEDIVRDAEGKLLSDGTWTYKPPTIDIIPQKFNVGVG